MQITTAFPQKSGESVSSTRPKPRHPLITYETLVWSVFIVITILACVDRFTTNVWPRQTHSIGAGFAGSDKTDGLKEGPWTVAFYDIVARISGRYSIVALNLLFFTMMRSTASALSESWAAKVVDMRDIVDANVRLHKWNGITLVVMTLVHVWSILMPPIFNGWRAQVLAGSFEWILSERKPAGFKDINVKTETVSLQVDDVFRIVEMTLLLAVLIPLSVRWFTTRYHLGIHIHRFVAVVYFIDIVRRHTHPHSWFLNTPFFVAWIADHVFGVYWRRLKPQVLRKQLSEDYMLLFWDQPIRSNTVGPKYYLRLQDSSWLEQAHVFTGFENRRGLDLADGKPWSAALLIRVYHNRRKIRIGRKEKWSHTKRVAEATNLDLWTWGPFHGSMSESARSWLESGADVTVVAGGSAGGYVVDALQRGCKGNLTVLYTCRDAGVFEWMVNVVNKLGGDNVYAVIAVTSGGDVDENVKQIVERKKMELEEDGSSSEGGRLRVQYGRIEFTKEISTGEVVFFQGSGGLQRVVAKATKQNGGKFIAGPAFDQEKKKIELLKKLRLDCLKGEERV